MKTYTAFMRRVKSNVGDKANFTFTVQVVSSDIACHNAEPQSPGYKCANGPVSHDVL